VIKLNVNWGVEGDSMAQTIHFWSYTGGAPGAGDLTNFANQAVTSGMSAFQALCNDQVGMLGATARDLSSEMGVEVTAGTPWVGTRGAALTPPGAALVISHVIARHYRGGKPRSYLPLGVGGDIATTGFWTDALVAAADSKWGEWTSDIIGGSPYGGLTITNIVNVSYYGPPNRTIGALPGRVRTVSTRRDVPIVDTITGHVARKVIGSQRRRNRDA
jgi:hypothetical protein